MKMNLMIITLKMVLFLPTLVAGPSVTSTASFARNETPYASPKGNTYNRHLPRMFKKTYDLGQARCASIHAVQKHLPIRFAWTSIVSKS